MSTNNSNPNPAVSINALVGFLELYLVKKAPTLPTNIKNFIVMVAPYLTIVSLIFTVPALLSTTKNLISAVFILGIFVLEIIAIPGLFKKTKFAWNMVFYAELISIVSGLINFSILASIIFPLISLYILFQIKEYYK